MGLSLESALTQPSGTPGVIAGHGLDEWNAAYTRAENYFRALRVRNKLLRGQLVSRVVDRAIRRAGTEAERLPLQLVAEEMERVVMEWFAAVLEQALDGQGSELDVRGRLSLLLADMPGRWQDQFLRPGPWPEEFVVAMRHSYLRAGPDFQYAIMTPRPIDLGPITTLTTLGNIASVRMVLAWIAFGILLIVVFQITH
jgi:hypothetical protein